MTQSALLDSEPTMALAADSDTLYEVVGGERKELDPISAFEIALAWQLSWYLGEFVQSHRLGLVVTEMLFLLDVSSGQERRPDVAFVSYPRWQTPLPPRTKSWRVVPDMAVEIVSPTNLAEEIEGKVVEYFQAGVRLVWVVYPDSGRVYVYSSLNQVRILNRTDELDGGDVLPGFRLRIEALYTAVTKPE